MADYTDDTATIEDVATDTAPPASLAVDVTNEPSAEEAPKPLADDNNSVDPFNQSAGDRSTFDKINKGIAADRVAGDLTIGQPGGGPLYQETPEEKKEREEQEFWEQMNDLIEEQQKAAREFDEKMHKIGDYEYSGAHLHAMKEWLDDEKNADAFENELMQKNGISKDEAKKRRIAAQDYLAILEKERNGQKLTEEEKRLKANPPGTIAEDIKTLSEKVAAPVGQKYGFTEKSVTTGQTIYSQTSSTVAGDTTIAKMKVAEAAQPTQKDFEQTMLLTQKQKSGLLTDAERAQLNRLQSDPNVIAAVESHFSKMKEQAEATRNQGGGDSLTASTFKSVPLAATFERADNAPIPLDKEPTLKSDVQKFALAKTAAPAQTMDTF